MYSKLDSLYEITKKSWALSLIRNADHAAIVLEGVSQDYPEGFVKVCRFNSSTSAGLVSGSAGAAASDLESVELGVAGLHSMHSQSTQFPIESFAYEAINKSQLFEMLKIRDCEINTYNCDAELMERFFAADLPHLPIDILVPEAQISRSRFLAERKMRQLGFEVSGLASEPVEMFAGHEGDAFIKAVQQGNLKAVVGFLHRNIDINYQPQFRGGHKGRTALMHAAENRNEPMVRLLLACGADASLEYCPPSVGLVMAYLFSGNYSVLNAVDFAFDSGDENIFTMLYEASKYSLREGKIGDLLFKALAKMGEGGAFGEFLREWALSKAINEVKNVKELLVTDSQDYTLLMRATEKNHFEFAQILLAQISRLSKDNTLLLYVNQRRIGESSAEGATLPFKTALNIAQDKGYFMFVELFNVMASIDNKTEIVP